MWDLAWIIPASLTGWNLLAYVILALAIIHCTYNLLTFLIKTIRSIFSKKPELFVCDECKHCVYYDNALWKEVAKDKGCRHVD